MHNNEIELPPLPKGDIAADTCPVMWVHSDEQLQEYALAAIEADRQQRHLKECAQLNQEWAVLKDMQAQYEADRKRRGEPVAWGAFYFGGKRNGKLYNHTETEAQIDAYIADVHRSNDSITLRKGPLYTALQPAEPECNHCGGTGDVSGEYPGTACPACAGTGKVPQPAAPQLAVSPSLLSDIRELAAYAEGSKSPRMVCASRAAWAWLEGAQPAEPVKRKRRYAQGTALGEFGIIPMCDQVDDKLVKVSIDDLKYGEEV